MTSDIIKAVWELLQTSELFQNVLAKYAGLPAVFAVEPVPESARLPYIIISQPFASVDNDAKGISGQDVSFDVRVYYETTGSAEMVDVLANEVYQLLNHNSRLEYTADGGQTYESLLPAGNNISLIVCSMPIEAPTEEAVGRLLNVRMTFNLT